MYETEENAREMKSTVGLLSPEHFLLLLTGVFSWKSASQFKQ